MSEVLEGLQDCPEELRAPVSALIRALDAYLGRNGRVLVGAIVAGVAVKVESVDEGGIARSSASHGTEVALLQWARSGAVVQEGSAMGVQIATEVRTALDKALEHGLVASPEDVARRGQS